MTTRTAITPGTELQFGQDTRYIIKGEVGRGGSCIVYDAVYKTNAGDEKTVRIKECYPFDLQLERDAENVLHCFPDDVAQFEKTKTQMFTDFLLCNRLFYAESLSASIINTINIHEANNTVYIVSAWSRENVLSSVIINTLRDCISIVRQTAVAIESIHKAGFLYLDIKPDNISVINGSPRRVQLFDFDSLIPFSALQKGIYKLISYTKGFAALELRRGQFSKMGFQTDVFGVGALLFYLLFGRTPEAPDCVNGSVYDFSCIRFSGPWPDRLIHHLDMFFRRTLAAFAPDRWQSMSDVVRELEIIENLADPVYPYLVSTPLNSPAYFIGRAIEMEKLNTWLEENTNQTLFISGMGGIGKSTFIRFFLAEHHDEFDSVLFLYYRNNLFQTIVDDSSFRINGTERFPEEKETDYFKRKLRKIREILNRDRVIMVIDNFENLHDPDLDLILGLNCKKIFITRQSLGSLNLPVLKIDSIQDPEDLVQMFIHYLDRQITNDEKNTMRTIIQMLAGHTLAIELFARQISNSFLSFSEALELLHKQGIMHASSGRVDYLRDNRISYEQTEAIITSLFETDSLSDEQISILKAAALFPAPGIEVQEFIRLAGINTADGILLLIRYGWISRDHERIFLHPLIREVITNLPVNEETQKAVISVLDTLYEEIISESHKEEINISLIDNIPVGFRGIDPYDIVTDYKKLNCSVSIARSIIDTISNDLQFGKTLMAQKLFQAMVTNLPKYEDDAILKLGKKLLTNPEYLSPLEILEVVESVEKALLARQEYDMAVHLMKWAESFAVDERTKAEFCGMMSDIYDYRDAPGDQEEMLSWLEEGIVHARLAPSPERKHLLAEYLLGKLNVFTRNGIEDDSGIEGLIRELMVIIEKECLPYSEIRCGFAVAMGFFWAELGKDREETDGWITTSRRIGEKLYPAGLDFIDNCIIPPAIMYLDLKDYDASENALSEGILICDAHPELIAYIRKKHDLLRYLLDVYLEKGDYSGSIELLSKYDEISEEYGFPDTINQLVRQFLSDKSSK